MGDCLIESFYEGSEILSRSLLLSGCSSRYIVVAHSILDREVSIRVIEGGGKYNWGRVANGVQRFLSHSAGMVVVLEEPLLGDLLCV